MFISLLFLLLATSFGLRWPSSGQYLQKKRKNACVYSKKCSCYGKCICSKLFWDSI